ncbi:MAG TPA: acyl-CoA synthetase [Gammaproteobacteria bacterium]|nr:acyl-CoA synthetase [Gammaproteobacteria bacterium]
MYDKKNKLNAKTWPLIFQDSPDDVIAVQNGKVISRAQFLQHVNQLATRLPEKAYVINLCQNRYHFMVSFAAAILARQVTLLPSNQVCNEVNTLTEAYQDSYIVLDSAIPDLIAEQFYVEIEADDDLAGDGKTVPEIPADQMVAMVFTSGSTGQSKGNHKYWGELSAGTALLASRFGFDVSVVYTIVATVVPQHMFGLETSILLPMLTPTRMHIDRPFYPADVQRSLAEAGLPRVLVTTPIHLRAIHNAGIDWPETKFVLSATAPLSRDLAEGIESVMQTEVCEIFGCTEAGSFASRKTVQDDGWILYDGFSLRVGRSRSELLAPHLSQPVYLFDVVEIISPGHFRVLGRHADLLNIAGKRASMGDLNQKLMQIKGVDDGVFYMPVPFEDEKSVVRLAVFVVAPDIPDDVIMLELSRNIDAAFLPRHIIRLEQLPYNNMGKLPHQALSDLYNRYKRK